MFVRSHSSSIIQVLSSSYGVYVVVLVRIKMENYINHHGGFFSYCGEVIESKQQLNISRKSVPLEKNKAEKAKSLSGGGGREACNSKENSEVRALHPEPRRKRREVCLRISREGEGLRGPAEWCWGEREDAGPHRQSGRQPQKTGPAALWAVGWEDGECRQRRETICHGITPVDPLESSSRVTIWEGAAAIT